MEVSWLDKVRSQFMYLRYIDGFSLAIKYVHITLGFIILHNIKWLFCFNLNACLSCRPEIAKLFGAGTKSEVSL